MKKLCLTTSIALILSVLNGSVFAAVSNPVSHSPVGKLEVVDGEIKNIDDARAGPVYFDAEDRHSWVQIMNTGVLITTIAGVLGGAEGREFDAGWVCYLTGLGQIAGRYERIRLQPPGEDGPYLTSREEAEESGGTIVPGRTPVWTFVYRVTQDGHYYPRVMYRCLH